MAAKGKQTQRAAWEVDFLHVELDKAQRDAVKLWDVKYEATIDGIERLVLDGCKISVSHDKGNDTFIAACTSPKVEGGARQWCLVARGPSYLDSLRSLLYKFQVVLGGDISSVREGAENRSQWG